MKRLKYHSFYSLEMNANKIEVDVRWFKCTISLSKDDADNDK